MLYLYKEILPNVDNKYYYFTTIAQYKNALASKLVKSVSVDNYRINTNIIKLAIDATITEAIADTLTYVIDEREDVNHVITYFRCYHVNRIVIQSGYVSLYCSVDLWASYFYKANITNLVVTRCNRNIGTGLLDTMAGTKGSLTHTYCAVSGHTSGSNNELWNNDDVYIVFALKMNVRQSATGAVSRIKLYAFNIRSIRALYYQCAVDAEATGIDLYNASIQNPIQLAKDLVSGIYGITGYNGFDYPTFLNAVVLGAWLINGISVVEDTTTTLCIEWNRQYKNDINLHPLEVLDIETTTTLTITNDFNKQFYIGTRQNGLKVQRTTESSITITIKVIPSNDKITVIALQGDTQQDITSAFSITLGTIDGDISAERAFLSAFESATKVIGSGFAMVKGATSGNAFALTTGILGFSNSIGDVIGQGRNNHIGGQISGGDGSIAFNRYYGGDIDHPEENYKIPLANPYIVNAYTSINDEKVNVRLYGAKFNELTSFANVFSASLMGTGTLTDTFIQAICNIDNIPTEAGDVIKARLSNGIYLINLNT